MKAVWLLVAFALGVLVGATCFGQTPASELRAALQDAESLPNELRPSVRYLTLYAIPAPDRQESAKVVAYAVNALSRTRAMTPIHWISDTLGRFSIISYAPSATEFKQWHAAWETLAEFDPYWHIRTEIIDRIPGRPARGNVAAVAAVTKTKIVTTDGGWIGLAAAQKLKQATASNGPILRADYFVATALITPRYYEFAGIPPNESDFLKSLGVDIAVIDRLRANAGANLIISGVTGKPRRIIWSQGPLGGVYETLDVERVDAQRDPIRRPITAHGLQLKYDAGEWFALAANGLWKTALYDSAGKLQQSVPDKIAKDTSDPHGDGIVTPLLSCIRCHVEAGLRPFADDQTKLLAKSLLQSFDPAIIMRAAEFYDEPRLKRQMSFDRETYRAAVAQVTGGMKPEELSAALAKLVRNYAYLPVTVEQAARECGVDTDEFRSAVVNTHDPILLTLLAGRPVLRGQFDSSFAEAIFACERKP